MIEDKYTIDHRTLDCIGSLRAGDTIVYWSNGVCCELVGDYCMWPKQEPRRFVVVNDGYSSIDIKPEKHFIDQKIYIGKSQEPIKFYQKLNRKKW